MELDFLKENLININNKVIPNYEVSGKEVYFDLFISPEKNLCIIGRVDNNYLCWCSLTAIGDNEINSKIFDYVAKNTFRIFSQEHRIFSREKVAEIQSWFRCSITRSTYKGMLWSTPFGHCYGIENKKEHGRYFGNDIGPFYYEQLKICEFRADGDNYLKILDDYLQTLKIDKDELHYCKMKPLISVLKNEAYLRLSPDMQLRKLYLECIEECDSLYNRYMTAVR